MAQEDLEVTRWRDAFSALLKDAPADYERRYHQYRAFQRILQEELSRSLGHALREYLVSQRQATFAEKVALTERLDQQLRDLGLALLCHGPDRPGVLTAESTGEKPIDRGQFVLAVKGPAGEHGKIMWKRRTLPLDLIELIPDEPDAFAARVASARARSGRQHSR